MTQDPPRTTTETPAPGDGAEYHAFALEDEQDRKRVRRALAGAVVVHLVLFIVPLGFLKPQPAIAEPKRQVVFPMTPVRFTPPPPQTQQELPPQRVRRVPIPDPTPDEPEPLRVNEEIPHEIDLPDIDIVSDIPVGPPPIESEGPFEFGGDIARPVKISGPEPQYTEIARRARIQGVVIVEAIIDKRGRVTNVRVLKPLPMGLDQAAVDAISRWRFEPATLHGKPVDVYYSLTVNFRLQ